MRDLQRPTSKNFSVLWETFRFLKPYKFQLTISSLALLLTAGFTLSLGQGLRILLDKGFAARSKEELTYALAIIVFLGFFMSIGTFFRHYYVSWIGERVSSDMRNAVFSHVISLHPHFFEINTPGEIQSRITTDTSLIQNVIGSSASIALRNLLMFIGGVIFLLFTNFKLTFIVICSVPLVLFPIFFFGKRVRNLSRDSQDKIASVGSFVSEALLNIKILQSFHQEKASETLFASHVEKAFDVAVHRIKQRAFLIATVILMILAGISFMLWIGGIDVLEGRITGGELIAFAFYAIMVSSAVGAISEVIGDLQRAAGATERLVELLTSESIIKDPIHPLQMPERPKGELILKNVSFHYPSRPDQSALSDVSIHIIPGKTTAVVGPSGAGKSTLFELILRFYDPESGEIYFDGNLITSLRLEDLRKNIGYVPQAPTLFSGTLRENILFGNPKASKEKLDLAIEQSYVSEFIDQLPQGLDTDLGHLGIRLSGGQKQRISIARAIVKDPSLLLLDEATSALDSESERMVQTALEQVMKNRTTIIIAHRLSTIVRSDQIVVMDGGKVLQVGTHDELLKSSQLYANLASLSKVNR